MAEHFLISVDLDTLQSTQGLDLKTTAYLNRVHIKVTQQNHGAATAFLQKHFNDFITYCNVTSLECLPDIVSLLDNGAAKVIVELWQLNAIVEDRILEKESLQRLIVSFDHSACIGDPAKTVKEIQSDIQTAVKDEPVGIQVHDVHDWKLLDMMHEYSKLPGGYPSRYVTLADNTLDNYIKAVKGGHIPIVPVAALTTDPQKYPHLLPAYLLITSAIHTDRHDGLYPTVVANEHGICLGLVYSNERSVEVALQSGRGVYHSRSRNGLWIKGEESGDTQDLISIGWDCDADALQFTVRQKGDGSSHLSYRKAEVGAFANSVVGFCHLKSSTCFGPYLGLARLERTLQTRKVSAPTGSYTAKLFSNPKLLQAKIMEEASELCEATSKEEISAEAADLFYFALAKCVASGVSLEDVERNLDLKHSKATRRKGDAKLYWAEKVGLESSTVNSSGTPIESQDKPAKQHLAQPNLTQNDKSQNTEIVKEAASVPKSKEDDSGIRDGKIRMRRFRTSTTDAAILQDVLQRPSQRSTDHILNIVGPIIKDVRDGGDAALLRYTHKFEKATSLNSPVLRAPFPQHLMQLPPETIEAIDISFKNIESFHAAQLETKPLQKETMPGVVCARFSRPIERVGCYVPGGTAVLPSTAMMLGVPAMVAGCKKIIIASPPRNDGTITPEIVYVAHKVGAESIVLAGGAQAVAAMAHGTESVTKVDKILGPGNQFVTAAKMLVSNDTTACVSIDMPAGPSEVLVIADKSANPAFVASDLLSQAEHGVDSQVILIAVGLNEQQLAAIEDELHTQAKALPRMYIVSGAIEHSVTLVVEDIKEAMVWSNKWAPEHLILQVENAEAVVAMVENAGSVFVGPWTPESVGDYSAGVNHSLRQSPFLVLVPNANFQSHSDLRLRQTVLRSQSLLVHKAYHKLPPHETGLEKRWRRGDAARKGGAAGGPPPSCEY